MHIVIIGGSGGIGSTFVSTLAARETVTSITATYHSSRPDTSHPKVHWTRLDVTDEASVEALSQAVGEIDWLVNAVGILHVDGNLPEKTIRQLDTDFFQQNIRVNTIPTLLLAKHLQNRFKHKRPAVFATISAKVGSIGDNRLGGWYSYRASKAALNMCLKTLSIEWKRLLPNVAVAALHPGTTDTALSRPFQKNVPEKWLFTPEYSVQRMLEVLDALQPDDTGAFRAFDGERLPW